MSSAGDTIGAWSFACRPVKWAAIITSLSVPNAWRCTWPWAGNGATASPGSILSDEPTDRDTLAEYGQRFRIEENFLDDKSNGFQLESSQLRDARTLTRLLLVLAVATLYLTCQGAAVVAQGQRRRVDTHWFRGHSYLRLGWHALRYALAHREALLQRLTLRSLQDPDPAQASRRQGRQKRQQARWMDPLPACYALLLPALEAA